MIGNILEPLQKPEKWDIVVLRADGYNPEKTSMVVYASGKHGIDGYKTSLTWVN